MNQTILIDGNKISNDICNQLKLKVLKLKANQLKPKLIIIYIGNDFASLVYIRNKIIKCKKIGFLLKVINLDENTSYETVKKLIKKLNNDITVHGILIQLPLPLSLKPFQEQLLQQIKIEKDIDCFNFYNFGKFSKNISPLIYPCTPKAIITLIKKYEIEVKGKNVVVIGNSNIVGKAILIILANMEASVTSCNIYSKNIKYYTINADIIITATGAKDVITFDMVKKGVIIFDAGIIRDGNNKIQGDVTYKDFLNKAKMITPVPGGIGPVTVAILMENLWALYNYQNNKKIKY